MRTVTDFAFSRLVTRTRVLSGRLRCAAVRRPGSKRVPLAVLRPCQCRPYHEAVPASASAGAAKAGETTCKPASLLPPAERASTIAGAVQNENNFRTDKTVSSEGRL